MASATGFSGEVGAGTGFVWDEAGHVVTNNHVVQGAQTVIRMPGGEDIPAEVIGRAPQYDVAVLRLQRAVGMRRRLPLGTSNDLQVGQAVFAIGNPFGFDRTITVRHRQRARAPIADAGRPRNRGRDPN